MPELGKQAINIGMRIFVVLTMVQVAEGFWFLLSLTREVMMLFMGGNGLATAFFAVSTVLSVLVIVLASRKKIIATAACSVVIIYLMSFLRDFIRAGYLKSVFNVAMLKMVPQYSPLLMFLLTLVAAVPVILWMIIKAREAFSE